MCYVIKPSNSKKDRQLLSSVFVKQGEKLTSLNKRDLIHWPRNRSQFQAFVKKAIYVTVPCNEFCTWASGAIVAFVKGNLSVGQTAYISFRV